METEINIKTIDNLETEINIKTINNLKIEILLSDNDDENSQIIVDKKAHDKLLKLEIYEILNKIKENTNKENIEFLFPIKYKEYEVVKELSKIYKIHFF